jgi:hypothetical protein
VSDGFRSELHSSERFEKALKLRTVSSRMSVAARNVRGNTRRRSLQQLAYLKSQCPRCSRHSANRRWRHLRPSASLHLADRQPSDRRRVPRNGRISQRVYTAGGMSVHLSPHSGLACLELAPDIGKVEELVWSGEHRVPETGLDGEGERGGACQGEKGREEKHKEARHPRRVLCRRHASATLARAQTDTRAGTSTMTLQ